MDTNLVDTQKTQLGLLRRRMNQFSGKNCPVDLPQNPEIDEAVSLAYAAVVS